MFKHETVKDEDDLGLKPLDNVDIDDNAILTMAQQSKPVKAEVPALKLSDGGASKKSARRSLDSCMEKNKKNGKKQPKQQQMSKELNLGDFIVDNRGKRKDKKGKRRSEGSNLNQSVEKPVTVVQPVKLVSDSVPEEPVSMTPEKKANFVNSQVWDNIAKSMDKSETKPLSPKLPKPDLRRHQLVEPTPLMVTYKNQLDKLAGLYVYCLKKNLVPNILVELYLVLELLTVKNTDTSEEKYLNSYFGNVHNCVYFATRVLDAYCLNLLCGADRVTLRYLLENPRLDNFVPGLRNKISDVSIANERYLKKNGPLKQVKTSNDLQSVRYQCETDNRENFPDNQTFQDFRRQRDMFYDILRGWIFLVENGYKQTSGGKPAPPTKKGGKKPRPTFPLEEHFGAEINALITLQLNPVNMAHFAELFQNQLLNTCMNELTNESQNSDDLSRELSMPKVEADKLKRLLTRCITPSNHGGPCPKPKFTGSQEFFRDFLRVAGGNHVFITHLKNNLVTSINGLNEKMFEIKTDHDFGYNSKLGFFVVKSNNAEYLFAEVFEETDDEDLYRTILSLRILAKFLGYLEAMPYQSKSSMDTEKVTQAQFNLRKKV